MQHLTLGGVRDEVAPTLLEIILSTDCTSDLLAELFTAMPPRTAAAMMVKLPAVRFLRLAHFAQQLLSKDDSDVVNLLVPALLNHDTPEVAALVGECLQRTHGAEWSARALHPACNYLLTHGLGQKYLMPLARSSKAEIKVRLLALRTLSTDPGLLEEASRWSFSELIEPADVRARLQEMRKQVKAAKGEKVTT